MRSVAGGIDGLGAVFDDGSLVADAGLLLAGTVMSRLGLEALIDDTVRPGGSAGSGAGRKVLSLVASMLVGGCCIVLCICWRQVLVFSSSGQGGGPGQEAAASFRA